MFIDEQQEELITVNISVNVQSDEDIALLVLDRQDVREILEDRELNIR